jgi:hypothetical protein
MKKLVLSVMLSGFALALQAGEDASCSAGSCCSAQKASTQAKAQCTMTKQAANTCTKANKAGMKQASLKRPLKSPKATG